MIGIPGPWLIAILLLGLIVLLRAKGISAARSLSTRPDLVLPDDGVDFPPCPPEFVLRIFSREDLNFVSATNSPQLEKLFRRERKAVALLWVQQTRAMIQAIMREHALLSRSASDLRFSAEFRLVLQYAQLMLICGILFLVMQLAGPLWLRGLAVYADTLSRHIAETGQAFKAGTTAHTLTNARSS
jgi:hypothetical protein